MRVFVAGATGVIGRPLVAELVARLLDALGTPAVVELTQMIALENMRSRCNSAAGLQSQGYSDVCDLPLAVPSRS